MRNPFILSVIISTSIFLIGLLIGYGLDKSRTEYLAGEIRDISLRSDMFLMENLFLEKKSRNFCNTAKTVMNDLARTTEEFGSLVESFNNKRIFNKEKYDYLINKYYVEEVRFWLTMEEIKSKCKENITTVLFFHGKDFNSKKVGYILTDIREKNQGNVFVFSFNINHKGNSLLNLIKEEYNITKAPTLIINGKKFEIFDKEEIERVISGG